MPLTLSITNVSAATMFAVPPQLNSAGDLTYTPKPNAHGKATVTVTLQDSGGTAAGGIDTVTKTFLIVVDKPYPLHNTLNDYDVNGDGHIFPNDALGVINFINAYGSQAVITDSSNPAYRDGPNFVDVDRSNFISPHDALQVINLINAGLNGEGEAAPAASSPAPVDAFFAQVGNSARPSSTMSDLVAAALLDISATSSRKRPISPVP
jgi:hypothetical protein